MADHIRDVMTQNPQTLPASATAREAAETMRANDIGDVIAIDDKGGVVGIVTDRDVVVRVVAEGRDPRATQIEDIASRELTVVSPDDPVAGRRAHARAGGPAPAGGQAGQNCRHRQHRRPGRRARLGLGAGRYLRRPAQHLAPRKRGKPRSVGAIYSQPDPAVYGAHHGEESVARRRSQLLG